MKLLILLLVGLAAAKVRYDGYKVFQFTPQNQEQLDLLMKLKNWDQMDFWQEPGIIGNSCDLMVPPKLIEHILTITKNIGLGHKMINRNVQLELDVEEKRLAEKPDTHVFDYNDYNPIDEFLPELENLAAACPTGFTCETYSVGQSYDGREMDVLRINGGAPRGIWLDSHMHAREWLTGATLMRVVDKMVRQYGSDAESTFLMDNFNWMICPVSNPDGYAYSWTDDRLWRKTRSPNAGSSCVGTDMNRNWDDHWGGPGSSTNPCAADYRGVSPESEIETQNIANELRRLHPTAGAIAYMSWHAYGNYILHPWGWTCDDAPDHAEMNRVANILADAIEDTHGTTWSRGSICDTIYAASGGTIDWTYSGGGIVYSYGPEMRGNTFSPPASEIQPSFEEMWNGVVAMCNAFP